MAEEIRQDIDGNDVLVTDDEMVELPRGLIEDILHELISSNGLQAFDRVSYIGTGYVELDDDDIININNDNLIEIIKGYL